MPTARVRHPCQPCGYPSPKWLGRCPDCGEWSAFAEEVASAGGTRLRAVAPPEVVSVAEIAAEAEPRTSTGIGEFDRVLGGGIVPGSLILIGGEPGAGKSTLVTQVAARVAAGGRKVLYASGEESARQTRMRAERLGTLPSGLLLLAENNLDVIVQALETHTPPLAVIDSIPAVYCPHTLTVPCR